MTTPDSGGIGQVQSGNQIPLNNWFNNGTISSTGWSNNNYFATINALDPPPMKTFVYSPEVRVIIAHGAMQYDVSEDIIRTSLTRSENSAASFSVTLHNKDLRYTPFDRQRFTPMDRIVVYMKKTSWTQVFAGYLDSVPYRQLYPGVVEITATCTIKRLMHTWWNPDLPDSMVLFTQTPGALLGMSSADTALGGLLATLLTKVGGWNPMDVHIQQFPMIFFEFLLSMVAINNNEGQAKSNYLRNLVIGDTTLTAPRAYAGANPSAGTPGPTVGATGVAGIANMAGLPATTAFYVTQIVAACDEKGLGPQVIDNNVGAALVQAGTTGASGGAGGSAATMGASSGETEAWNMILQTGQNWQLSNRSSDGAILGVAAAMVDSGGQGVAIRNAYNPAVTGSDAFANDGPNVNGTACGIMGQQAYAEWGNVAQRMNPKQAAGMFFAQLASISGWRNMDPAQAIQMTQRTASSSPYTSAIQLATAAVQAYRTSMTSQASTVMPGGGTAGTSVGAIGSQIPGVSTSSLGAVSSAGLQVPGTASLGTLSPTRANKPQPDSEGAINWARTQVGMPYVYGGNGLGVGYDCSSLVQHAFKSIGVAVPRTTGEMLAFGSLSSVYPQTSVQRGDLVFPSAGHVVLWAGATIIEAQQDGVPVHEVPSATIGLPGSWAGVRRACSNGGIDSTALYNPPETMGPGNPPSGVSQVGAPGEGTGGTPGGNEGIALNLFSYIFGGYDTVKAQLFSGRRAFIDGQPLIEAIQAVSAAGLRSWSSGPDGSFIAWYPDYWGLDGKPAVLRLEDIELKDCRIDLSDDPLTTHVYINGDLQQQGLPDDTQGWLMTAGVVTVEDPDMWLWKRLAQVTPMDDGVSTGGQMMRRYGIRPMKRTYAIAGSLELEFLIACKVFLEQWSKRYETEISMTFMPELFPGMRVELGGHNLQVYVTSVTHICDYEQGFHTAATIVAPATPWAKALMQATNTPNFQGAEFTGVINNYAARIMGGTG